MLFRRLLNYKALDFQSIAGATGPSSTFAGVAQDPDISGYQLTSWWQAYSNRSPADDGVGNYATYAEMVTEESGIQMFVSSQGTHIQDFNDDNRTVVQVGMNGRVKIIQTAADSNPILETKPTVVDNDIFHEAPFTFDILSGPSGKLLHEGNIANQSQGGNPAIVSLNPSSTISNPSFPLNVDQYNSEFNCFTYGNGVEANKIKGELNEANLRYSPRVSSFIEKYQQEYLPSSLTYSGVFVENTNVNNLNEFNLSLGNYKDLSREYGPVEKLHARDNDLVTLQEDKVSKVLYGKNLL